MIKGCFVTGTDTGVGKTLVSCALLRTLAARGRRVVGMKPVAAGAEPSADGFVNDDVEQLMASANVVAPREHVNPYCFRLAIAPHIAAAAAGVEIRIDRICASYAQLAALADVVIVEGAGGFRVPLGAQDDSARLAVALALPVVLVVGMRLGCLNHALLTAEAIASRGLKLAGWIANQVDADMAAADENLRTLEMLIAAPLLARIGFCANPEPGQVARCFDGAALETARIA